MSAAKRFITEEENIALTYGLAFSIGAVILLIGLWSSNWNIGAWLTDPIVFSFLVFSATVIRMVAGFGLIATYIAVFEALLAIFSRVSKARKMAKIVKGIKAQGALDRDKIAQAVKSVKITESFKREKISEAVKGKKISAVLTGKKGQKARIAGIIFFLVLVPLLILGYVTLRFLSTLLYGAPVTLFDIAYLTVGIWGLLLTVYLLPVAGGESITLSGKLLDLRAKLREVEIRKGLTGIKTKVANFYSSRIKREQEEPGEEKAVDAIAEEYAFGHAQDYAEALDKIGFERVRETVLAYRHMITDDLLLPVALGSLILPPVALLFFAVWIRAFLLKKEVGQTLLERIIVIAAVVMAGLYASAEIILGQQITVIVSFDYLIGAFIGCIIFVYLARKAI